MGRVEDSEFDEGCLKPVRRDFEQRRRPLDACSSCVKATCLLRAPIALFLARVEAIVIAKADRRQECRKTFQQLVKQCVLVCGTLVDRGSGASRYIDEHGQKSAQEACLGPLTN